VIPGLVKNSPLSRRVARGYAEEMDRYGKIIRTAMGIICKNWQFGLLKSVNWKN
jgi:hypothetical protein